LQISTALDFSVLAPANNVPLACAFRGRPRDLPARAVSMSAGAFAPAAAAFAVMWF